jgi:hypothetical protein
MRKHHWKAVDLLGKLNNNFVVAMLPMCRHPDMECEYSYSAFFFLLAITKQTLKMALICILESYNYSHLYFGKIRTTTMYVFKID